MLNLVIESIHSSTDLKELYQARFSGKTRYRREIWSILCGFFSRWIRSSDTVLDLGCGYCEFINGVNCHSKIAMDLNSDAKELADPDVSVIEQDCSDVWRVDPGSLDIVFSSNFFEHLPSKLALEQTLCQAYRALKPGGRLIAMGPNIKFTAGAYWDFFDHYLPLTEASLAEVLRKCGFQIDMALDRFLPYTMSDGKQYPVWTLRAYLSCRPAWKIAGKQFLVVAQK